ncbi:MAG TPA: hypothetical protein VEY12_13005 [Thermoplasmata archaeon]|nr:hypothetical protein [Thermoplasmata archaeon]
MRTLGVILGVLIFVGFFTFQAVFLVQAPCTTISCPTPGSDQAVYSTTVHALAWAGLVMLDLSVGVAVMAAFFLNADSNVPETTRRSAFYFASLYLAAFTFFATFLMSFLFSYLRFI